MKILLLLYGIFLQQSFCIATENATIDWYKDTVPAITEYLLQNEYVAQIGDAAINTAMNDDELLTANLFLWSMSATTNLIKYRRFSAKILYRLLENITPAKMEKAPPIIQALTMSVLLDIYTYELFNKDIIKTKIDLLVQIGIEMQTQNGGWIVAENDDRITPTLWWLYALSMAEKYGWQINKAIFTHSAEFLRKSFVPPATTAITAMQYRYYLQVLLALLYAQTPINADIITELEKICLHNSMLLPHIAGNETPFDIYYYFTCVSNFLYPHNRRWLHNYTSLRENIVNAQTKNAFWCSPSTIAIFLNNANNAYCAVNTTAFISIILMNYQCYQPIKN